MSYHGLGATRSRTASATTTRRTAGHRGTLSTVNRTQPPVAAAKRPSPPPMPAVHISAGGRVAPESSISPTTTTKRGPAYEAVPGEMPGMMKESDGGGLKIGLIVAGVGILGVGLYFLRKK